MASKDQTDNRDSQVRSVVAKWVKGISKNSNSIQDVEKALLEVLQPTTLHAIFQDLSTKTNKYLEGFLPLFGLWKGPEGYFSTTKANAKKDVNLLFHLRRNSCQLIHFKPNASESQRRAASPYILTVKDSKTLELMPANLHASGKTAKFLFQVEGNKLKLAYYSDDQTDRPLSFQEMGVVVDEYTCVDKQMYEMSDGEEDDDNNSSDGSSDGEEGDSSFDPYAYKKQQQGQRPKSHHQLLDDEEDENDDVNFLDGEEEGDESGGVKQLTETTGKLGFEDDFDSQF